MSESTEIQPKKIVFIVGAGASNEANLPVGTELKKKIADILDFRFGNFDKLEGGDQKVFDALIHFKKDSTNPDDRDINHFVKAAQHICKAMPQAQSIDNFLDAHQGNTRMELCGKLAIVRSILIEERQCLMYFKKNHVSSTIIFKQLENTWFARFFHILVENCKVTDLSARLASIALVIFNYDRCFEHFLYHALQNYHGISPSEAKTLVVNLEIYHPYGTVGSLLWYSQNNADSIDFGADPSVSQLLQLSKGIKTFTEGTDPKSSDISVIQENIRSAKKLVFLGFAFHSQNLDLLVTETQEKPVMGEPGIFATGLDISDSDRSSIATGLANRCKTSLESIHIESSMKCSQLFDAYRQSIFLR
jgi:hypothetical protein